MRCGHLLYLPLAAVWGLTGCTTGSPEDQPPPVTVRAREGETAVLSCDLPRDPGDRTTSVIEWLHQGLVLPIFIKFGVHPPRIDAAYLGRLSLQEGTALRVEHLRSEDGGWYQCRVLLLTQPYDNLNGSWIYLSISTPPTFRRTAPPVVEIRLGGSALLPCEVQGRPAPLVIWSKDGSDLPLDSGRNGVASYKVTNESLKIESVDRSSMGVYTCEAKSEEGSVTHSTHLLVRGPPTIVLPPRNVTVNFSQDAFFTCETEAYPGNLTYTWLKQKINVHHLSDLRHRVNILTDGSLLLRETAAQDSGLYTCIPSNGLGTPPEASAYLTILHPAYARRMPEVTFLAAGMRGCIPCPIVAHPPLLYINWTKNGEALELDKLPGWYLEADGTIVIATGNDDALGDYACTPYNSYGTLGESNPTHVILKDPPRFVEQPADRYEQEVGRELSIGCSATGDPQPVVSWSKEGSGGRGRFQVLRDGTLFFSTISKDHHGAWTCVALNNITQIATSTQVVVLGTSPHAPTNVTVSSDVFGVNVSWEPGFDGGHAQQFTVWVRQTTRGPHDWIIRKVPLGDSQLRVEGLWPGTGYQFSVLAQSDRGSGPFSEIVTTWTLSVPVMTAPPSLPATDGPGLLLPPQGLAANRTARGILLSWAPPPPPSRTPLGYRLEFRQEGVWGVLHSVIPAGQEQLLLEGLVQDNTYQFRISALTEDLMSEPSDIVNISTSGMPVYPAGPRVREALAHPIRAGIIAACCFLATALVASVLVSCIMSRRRTRRGRLDVPIIFSRYQKAPHPVRSDSPDSVLKLKFESSGYETFEAVPRSPPRKSDEKHSQYESHLVCLESIRRGPDGRFMVELQRDPESPRLAAYPPPARPEASPEFQGARPGVALRSKARGQTRVRPQARYFALATSSPAADSQPPCIPDVSPIPPVLGPQSRLGVSPGPGLHGDHPGLDPRPSRSLLNLGCGDTGIGVLSHGLSWPGPLETAQPGLPPPGPCLRPTQPGPLASGLQGGLEGQEVACSPGLTPQASQPHCQALERPGATGPLPLGSIARPPSLAPSGGTGGSPAPDSSGFHSRDGSQRASAERSHVKRDISGDENYEWDAEFAVESEILEALRLYKRARPSRPNSSIVLQELEWKGSPGIIELKGSRNVRSLEALSQPQNPGDLRASAASRCAALREEFLEYRRRMEKEERALGKRLNYDERFEQATLL